jgi:hypothetical protein
VVRTSDIGRRGQTQKRVKFSGLCSSAKIGKPAEDWLTILIDPAH